MTDERIDQEGESGDRRAEVDRERREALRRGGAYPAAVNAVNERAVALFLAGKLPFSRIPALAEETLAKTLPTPSSVEDILEIDRCMRSEVTK